MATKEPTTWCLPLDSERADLATTGGKGTSLSKLARAGIPVPPGFHIVTGAYRRFVEVHRLDDLIGQILQGIDPTDPLSLRAGTRRIRAQFGDREIPQDIAEAVTAAYRELGGPAVAVRSSATAEDLPGMSFAGQMDSYLNVTGAADVLSAVRKCWASLWTDRAIQYRARHQIESQDVSLAVVVQELVDPSAAGVLFTVNPLNGSRDQMVINSGWGLGESLVSGDMTPDTHVVERPGLSLSDTQIGDKAVMTVRTATGTQSRPVPEERRGQPALSDSRVIELARIGVTIEDLYGQPMDIEWALSDDGFAIVQARPVTGLPEPEADREVWNDSLRGDYLWTASNVGEAMPSVMTPITWSFVQRNLSEAMAMPEVGHHRLSGNIGGRLYLNLSLMMAAASALGMGKIMRQAGELAFGVLPDSVTMPGIPMSRWKLLRLVIPDGVRFSKVVRTYQKDLGRRIAEYPARCAAARTLIAQASDAATLHRIWDDHCAPLLLDGPRMLAAGSRVNGMALARLGPWLRKHVDAADANALASGAHTGEQQLASLGPLLGLRQLAEDEIDRETFAQRWGHRCPDELEVIAPRPGEDPDWIDRQLAGLRDAVDIDNLLTRQAAARRAAAARFAERHPRKVRQLNRRSSDAAAAVRSREATRSESVRCMWVLRDWVLKVGEVTGIGEDAFFLHIEEVLEVLSGNRIALNHIDRRRAAYRHYQSLPVYPTLIRGSFDPEAWAADPARRTDLADPTGEPAPLGDTIGGTPGSSGVVEGIARVITDPADSATLRVGEILVTKITNIGWTPVFPRAAAVVTDIGATLSHASIVARELGIPAVVGCGTATARIRTGDRIRVDGDTGTVSILSDDTHRAGLDSPD